jgi:hypothetical protein
MAADPLFDEMLVLHSGAISDSGQILVIAVEQEKTDARLDHAHLLLWNGNEWRRAASLDYPCVRACWMIDRWIVLGATGALAIVSPAGDTIQTLYSTSSTTPAARIRRACILYSYCRRTDSHV